MKKNAQWIGFFLIAALWLALSVWAWLKPETEISVSERRKLDAFPKLQTQSVLDGSYMSQFEDAALDQFPARDTFRQLKSLVHYGILRQQDNNGIFFGGGYAAKLEYPLDTVSVAGAMDKFTGIYETYLAGTDSRIFFGVIPDKGYYLAPIYGTPTLDYEELTRMVAEGAPWAEVIDLSEHLTLEDYYRTDTHWRQERLLPAAGVLCQALGIDPPGDYTEETVLDAFRGVYYGQAALPVAGEPLTILRSSVIDGCTVDNYETGKTGPVYDMEKITARDPYEVYLSGSAALLTITNPAAQTERELIVFRDSFGSSMVPLLLHGYCKVTVIDTRYVAPSMLSQLVDFHGQDVLFLYSTLVLNNSGALR